MVGNAPGSPGRILVAVAGSTFRAVAISVTALTPATGSSGLAWSAAAVAASAFSTVAAPSSPLLMTSVIDLISAALAPSALAVEETTLASAAGGGLVGLAPTAAASAGVTAAMNP